MSDISRFSSADSGACDAPNALRAQAQAWLAAGDPAMLVEVLRARGSVPRAAGTRMLVSAQACAGTIGGGHLECQAIDLARAALANGTGALPDRDIALGPTLGQCCGGALTLRMHRLQPQHLAAWPDEPALLQLQLHGAGHVGRALVQLLAQLPCQVQWVDARAEAFPPGPLPAHVRVLASDTPAAEVALAPPGTFYLVMTHQHALDLEITRAILQRGDFGHLGLIGSATKRARFEHRLTERGFSAQALSRINCPIGLLGIGGKAPAVVALSVAAQLMQLAQQAATGSGRLNTGPLLV